MDVGGMEQEARLEGGLQLLWESWARLRTLEAALAAVFWRDRLRRLSALLRAQARAQEEVDRLCGAVLRRASLEGWSADGPAMRCLLELPPLRERVRLRAAHRLGSDASTQTLAGLLGELELALLRPPDLSRGDLLGAAKELLPHALAELRCVRPLAAELERLCLRPLHPDGSLSLLPAEVDHLGELLAKLAPPLAEVWRRVERCEAGTGLVSGLRRRASRAPRRAPRSGPEVLLHATFWQGFAQARQRLLVMDRFAPLAVAADELPRLLRWLALRRLEPYASLPARGDPAAEGRAGLLELAHGLYELRAARRARPMGSSLQARGLPSLWERLRPAALRAKTAVGPELQVLREALAAAVGSLEVLLSIRARAPCDCMDLEALVARGARLEACLRPASPRWLH